MLSVIATDLPRIIACNGSLGMEDFQSSIPADDSSRKEGDAAHWLIEQVHKHNQPLDTMLNKQAPNGVFITAEMMDHVTEYLSDIQGIGQVEFDTSFQDEKDKWKVGGRADHLYQGQGILRISDFKYGWRIVDVQMNWTLIWHAIGFLLRAKAAGINYPPTIFSVVEFIVYQPRPYHPKGTKRQWIIQRGDLERLWEKMEAVLNNPDSQLHTGSHCYKCPKMVSNKGLCPAFAKAMNNAIDASEQMFTDTISNQDLSQQLNVCARASEVLKQMYGAMEDLAKHRIREGQIVPDYIIEKSLGNSKWKENVTPEFLQMITGKDLTKKELMTPAQAKKLGVSPELVASMTTRESKGINLIRASADEQGQKLFNQGK